MPAAREWRKGDRFFILVPQHRDLESVHGPYRAVFGTVIHRRTMYGDSSGGTYMVKFDDPTLHDHNASGDQMLPVERAMDGVGRRVRYVR